jgi:uncharacterized protein (TIGR02145 family)/prepilin-type N-terminal cleavage/methylation domain-containing protein
MKLELNKKAFTLIELLVVIAIVGILSGLIVISMNGSIASANDTKRKANIDTIRKALIIYGTLNGMVYPIQPTQCDIASSGANRCTNFDNLSDLLPNIPKDPVTGNPYTYISNSTGTSFIVSAVLSSSTLSYNSNNGGYANGPIDIDGNAYNAVTIGTQTWMTSNLATSRYRNGTLINTNWVNSTDNGWAGYYTGGPFANEGRLYQWSCTQGTGNNALCPAGWHVPTDAEWNTLETYVVSRINSPNAQYPCDLSVLGWRRCADNSGTDAGGTYGAGKSLKKVGQGSGVGAGDDLVGFAGILSGYRGYADGVSYNRSSGSYFWSSSESSGSGLVRDLYSSYCTVYRYAVSKAYGFSVRCLKD